MLIVSDEELVARCKAELPGNTRSYEVLLQRHMNRVYNIIYRVVYNKEEAEDLSQEVFLKIYYGLKKFEQQASFASWLYRIATNCALDAIDKKKRQSRTLSFTPENKVQMSDHEKRDQLFDQTSKLAGPEERVIQSELRERINWVLCKLDREQAHLILLRDFDDRSYGEIASLLNIGLSAVKMRIHRARLAFQKLFGHFYEHRMVFSISSEGKLKENK